MPYDRVLRQNKARNETERSAIMPSEVLELKDLKRRHKSIIDSKIVGPGGRTEFGGLVPRTWMCQAHAALAKVRPEGISQEPQRTISTTLDPG